MRNVLLVVAIVLSVVAIVMSCIALFGNHAMRYAYYLLDRSFAINRQVREEMERSFDERITRLERSAGIDFTGRSIEIAHNAYRNTLNAATTANILSRESEDV